MIVAACVEAQKLAKLRGAVGETHRLHVALDWDHADSIVRRQPVDVLVVDPSFGSAGEVRTEPIRTLRSAFRSVPFVVYSALGSSTLRPLIELGRDGMEQLIIYGVDDDPRQLRRVLERQPGVALAARLSEMLQPRLRALPAAVSNAIERVIHTPAAFKGVPDLAAAANVSRRTIYRECERADLSSPREIIAGARVLRAYAFLRESDYAIEDVAEHLRFSSPHHLTKTMRWACGMTTARARDRIAPDDFVQMLAERLMPAPGSPPADEAP
ncbi:MAG: helix-turn-helix domain-containing protein [Gemmatimonadaceae bacterium]|nr:helix-turn-helix domain-containing protein [Gemmatimonadaceae bacterium]